MPNARLGIAAAMVILAGCASAPAASFEPSASAEATESPRSAMATRSPHLTASAIATPSTPTGMNLLGNLVAVVTDDLVVRSRPGTGSDSEIYPALLSAPTTVYVIAGPEVADGYEWYLVDPVTRPCYLGCEAEPTIGWVAAAGKDGERWLADEPTTDPECPDATLEALISAAPELRLSCFSGRELTLQGVVGTEAAEAPAGWPWDNRIQLYPPGYQGPVVGCVDVCTVPLTVGVDTGGEVPSPLSATRATGHFDDPNAERCQSPDSDLDQRIIAHGCRMLFVVTSWD